MTAAESWECEEGKEYSSDHESSLGRGVGGEGVGRGGRCLLK
jgi:hypothetical protein